MESNFIDFEKKLSVKQEVGSFSLFFVFPCDYVLFIYFIIPFVAVN